MESRGGWTDIRRHPEVRGGTAAERGQTKSPVSDRNENMRPARGAIPKGGFISQSFLG